MIGTEHTTPGNIGESQSIVTMVSFIDHRAIGAGHKVDGPGSGELMVVCDWVAVGATMAGTRW
jgi:hypothetical protein